MKEQGKGTFVSNQLHSLILIRVTAAGRSVFLQQMVHTQMEKGGEEFLEDKPRVDDVDVRRQHGFNPVRQLHFADL